MEKGNVLSVKDIDVKDIDYGEEDWKRIKILGERIFSEKQRTQRKEIWCRGEIVTDRDF